MSAFPGTPGDEPDPRDDEPALWEGSGSSLYDDADETIVELVADRLIADVRVRGRQMRVAVQNRVVILEGEVESEEAKEAAGRQAWATPGVNDVCNLLVPHLS